MIFYEQIINGNAGLAAFIVGISALTDMQKVGNFLLCQKMVFPDLSYPLIIAHAFTTLHNKYKDIGKKLDK